MFGDEICVIHHSPFFRTGRLRWPLHFFQTISHPLLGFLLYTRGIYEAHLPPSQVTSHEIDLPSHVFQFIEAFSYGKAKMLGLPAWRRCRRKIRMLFWCLFCCWWNFCKLGISREIGMGYIDILNLNTFLFFFSMEFATSCLVSMRMFALDFFRVCWF